MPYFNHPCFLSCKHSKHLQPIVWKTNILHYTRRNKWLCQQHCLTKRDNYLRRNLASGLFVLPPHRNSARSETSKLDMLMSLQKLWRVFFWPKKKSYLSTSFFSENGWYLGVSCNNVTILKNVRRSIQSRNDLIISSDAFGVPCFCQNVSGSNFTFR